MIQVSVIIPIYNAELFIERCVHSLLSQTLEGMEFVFIDDASSDRSVQILERAIASFGFCAHQVIILRNENRKGTAVTRQIGYLASHGQYIGSCDADDWVEPNMFELLHQSIITNKSDIAICDYLSEYATHSDRWHFCGCSDTHLCLQYASNPSFFAGTLWCHLLRRELVLAASFQVCPVNYGEDLYTLFHAYYRTSRICYVAKALYHYNHCNPSSLMTQASRPQGSWDGQRKNIDRIIALLSPQQHIEYQLTCQWLKFKVKEKFITAFPDLRTYYQEYNECHNHIKHYEYLPLTVRRKLSLIYSCYFAFWLYHQLPIFRKWLDKLRCFFLPKPHILSTSEIVFRIIHQRCSLSRFGDGELKVMNGANINFQVTSLQLQLRLREVALSRRSDIMIGIPDVFAHLERYTLNEQRFWREHLIYNRSQWYSFIDYHFDYANTFFTRFYSPTFNHEKATAQLLLLRQIWQDRDIITVEGSDSKLGVGNDLFENSRSISRIICPSRNAFASYNEILRVSLSVAYPNALYILALGPTATVLAYDLSQQGIQALDLGHLDIEYEWYLQKATCKVPIQGKFSNEAYLERNATTEVNGTIIDPSYETQVIFRI